MSDEIVASNNLRATHDILLAMSGSKRALEHILENQNDIFALFTDGGQILKGNEALSSIIKQPSDVLFRYNLKALFSAASWQLFANKIEVIKKHRERKDLTFELALDSDHSPRHDSRDFLWTINRFDSISTRRGQVYSLIGRDMTEIRRFQKRLGMIYGSVPLAIFQIDRQKRFSGPYSAYCEILFGRDDLDGLPYLEALAMAQPNLSPSQKAGLDQLVEALGEEEFWYDVYKGRFPKELNVGTKEIPLWISFNYSPIIRDAHVEEILVVAEDVTERVHSRGPNLNLEFAPSHYTEIFGNAQETEEQVVDRAISDIDEHLAIVDSITLETFNNSGQYLDSFRAIKDLSQAAGLGYITHRVNQVEDALMAEEMEGKPLPHLHASLQVHLQVIREAWAKVKSVLHVVHPVLIERSEFPADDMREKLVRLQLLLESKEGGEGVNIVTQLLSLMNPGIKLRNTLEIEHNLRSSFSKAAVRLDKEIHLEMTIAEIAISKEKLSKISEILTHILGFVLTEGIESRAERLDQQKKSRAQVKITLTKVDDIITIAVEDDGLGIDASRLVTLALKKGTLNEKQVLAMKPVDKFRLIFQPGLTQEGISGIKASGLGMSAADEIAKSISADHKGIGIESILGRGTVFTFKCVAN